MPWMEPRFAGVCRSRRYWPWLAVRHPVPASTAMQHATDEPRGLLDQPLHRQAGRGAVAPGDGVSDLFMGEDRLFHCLRQMNADLLCGPHPAPARPRSRKAALRPQRLPGETDLDLPGARRQGGADVMGRLVALVLALLPASGTRGGDWPQFRGPNGSGVSQETGLPTEWGKERNIRWKAPLPGRGNANPVIADGKVFVTASSGFRENRLHVLCLDQSSGRQLWHRQFQATGSTHCHPKNNMAAPTPVTDGKVVYAL